uniref:Homoserine O-acetyltransferase n=1 Tax=Candidatus Kentrum sp. MB TaxID=2138164 RepID=A0A450Y150_9GAMM|nr:MAG: hypothetical protein BECKMB1821G_GA0114241_105915 [Candidatus Kentron sp. MB]VFK35172.1 MAG: hypothetical protein BECKMB1821I_GA0114274_11034 [Candidatus Kentron sp. MB]VFK77105.1 MAG: hypothetical protein BECKMB1821H_GA0114242_11004 [Candidatus Kentron sp. MB]
MRANSADTRHMTGLIKLIPLLRYRDPEVYESFLKGEDDVERYLERVVGEMAGETDPRIYVNALRMMNRFDVSRDIQKGRSDFHIWAVSSDHMHTVAQHRAFHNDVTRRGIKSHFSVIDSDKGHDAFLLNEEKLIPYFERVL